MKNNHKLDNKKILVLGLGKSGISTVRLLHNLGVKMVINDGKKREECPFALELEQLNLETHYGSHPVTLLNQGVDLIIKSPGIPYYLPLLKEASLRNIPIVTEIEIGYLLTQAKMVGITGSNGKTTTTSLVGDMFQSGNVTHEVCGNIGTAFLDVALKEKIDWLIAELSSFQLKGTKEFQPNIAAFLNFSETHLDFHGDKEDYLSSKMNLFQNQTNRDYAVFNYDIPLFHELTEIIHSNIYWFSFQHEISKGTCIKEGWVTFKDETREVKIIKVADIPLKGSHNIENVLAASLIGILAGISVEAIQQAIRHFRAVEHRLELVATLEGVAYYNDSKSTNPVSTIKACEAFNEPIVLILGGKDRGSDFSELKETFRSGKIKSVIAFGETADKLQQVAKECQIKKTHSLQTLDECVLLAHQMAQKGEVVLLSPACASWGMYSSYEERGNHFKSTLSYIKEKITHS